MRINKVFIALSVLSLAIILMSWGSQQKVVAPAKIEWVPISFDTLAWDTSSYPFIRYELNEILRPGDSMALYNFYEKLNLFQTEGTGKINVVHIGGSHVQAGTLSSEMRHQFLELTGGELPSRGFVFPAKMVSSNGPDYLRCENDCEWKTYRSSVPKNQGQWCISGFNGRMISDSTSFKLWTFNRDSVIFPFNRLTFYGQKLDVFDLRFDSSVVLTDTIYGPDYREFVFEELQDTLSMEMVRWDSTTTDTLVLQGMHFWNDRPGITYHALGVNGSSAETFLKCDFQGMQKIHPDLVIFGLGINDAYKTEEEFDTLKFKNNYLEIMRRIQEFNPDVEFLFLTNSDSYYKRKVPNKNAFAVSRMMMEIAQEEENTAYWDLFEIMGGLNSIKTWEEFDLAKRDKIHFKRPGYRLEAELLFDALIRDYNTEAKKQTSYTPVLE